MNSEVDDELHQSACILDSEMDYDDHLRGCGEISETRFASRRESLSLVCTGYNKAWWPSPQALFSPLSTLSILPVPSSGCTCHVILVRCSGSARFSLHRSFRLWRCESSCQSIVYPWTRHLIAFGLLQTCNSNVVAYWGQNSYGAAGGAQANWQQRLSYYCNDASVDVFPIAFLDVFQGTGGDPEINLANTCNTE